MKKILVPVDFSEQSFNATKFALQFPSRSEIHFLHVVELPFMYKQPPGLSVEKEQIIDLQRQAEQRLMQMIDRFRVDDVKVVPTVSFGFAHSAILDYIKQHQVELVVMGTKGANGLREIFVGSNTEKIVRTSGVPVIAVKDNVKLRSVRNIVFPNIIEPDAHEDLVTRVKALQHSLNARLHVVYINTPLNFKSDIDIRESLARFARRYMLRDCTTHVFNDMEEETGIINFSRMINADLIAIGTHGRKGITHLLLGSIAEDLVNHTKLPVWTYTIKHESYIKKER